MSLDGFGRHTPSLSGTKVIRALSVDGALLTHLSDAINILANDYQWLEIGDPVDTIVQEIAAAVETWYTPMQIGQIGYFLGSLPPGWLALDGSTYDQVDYPELTSLLDSQFRNDIAENFTLPNLHNKFVSIAGDNYTLGDLDGADSHVLTTSEMPAHTHTYTFPVQGADIGGAGPPLPAVSTVTPGTATGSAGSDGSHENRPQFIALVAGIFSGRV